MTLPAGIGDAHPDDGVEPVDLMPALHVLPGIWTPIKGYDTLLHRLNSMQKQGKIGHVLPVPYDWRLSNRYNAQRLATIVDPVLQQWRSSSPQRADAQLVFVCHSMGGLVARWFIEKCGGAELTRKLITLGTPYRGAAKAVVQLVNGVRKELGPLSVDLTEFARSLPALHQLLPSYACIDHAGALLRLDETTVPELNTAMVKDALTFNTDLAAAEAARPASLATTYAIIGGAPADPDLPADQRHQGGEREKIVASRTPRIRDGHLETSFTGLTPGAYEIQVTGVTPGSPIAPVTAPVLVSPQHLKHDE